MWPKCLTAKTMASASFSNFTINASCLSAGKYSSRSAAASLSRPACVVHTPKRLIENYLLFQLQPENLLKKKLLLWSIKRLHWSLWITSLPKEYIKNT